MDLNGIETLPNQSMDDKLIIDNEPIEEYNDFYRN